MNLQLAVLASLAVTTSANAQLIVTFIGEPPAKDNFLAATEATSATGDLPYLGRVGGAHQFDGGITLVTDPPSNFLYIGGNPVGGVDFWTNLLPGYDIAIEYQEDLNVYLDMGYRYSFGFDFAESTWDHHAKSFVDSAFVVTLLDEFEVVDSFTFNAPNDVAAFVGVWSDTPFNSVRIRELTADFGNEYFGQFYTGVTPVPEPGTSLSRALLLLLPFGAAMIRRVSKNRKA